MNAEPEQAWGWVRDSLDPGATLIFTRGVSVERVIEVFGMDPATAQLVPESQVDEVLPDPVYGGGHEVTGPYLRVGRSGDWAFAIDPTYLSLYRHLDGDPVIQRLSAGTEVATITWTPKPNENLDYWVDGEWMTSFEPYMSYYRAGADPDRFVPEMRQVGLDTEPPGQEARSGEPTEDQDPLIATLDMLTLALGIRLSEKTASGPLLTVQRRSGA
jgi:hypothetical protein